MTEAGKKIIDAKLDSLSRSKFRTAFGLRKKELAYVEKYGMEKIRSHCRDFIRKNICPEVIPNDGKQTPTKNHPVFLAQHATATCCRGCLEKWHHISKGRALTINEENFVVELIMEWINREVTLKLKKND